MTALQQVEQPLSSATLKIMCLLLRRFTCFPSRKKTGHHRLLESVDGEMSRRVAIRTLVQRFSSEKTESLFIASKKFDLAIVPANQDIAERLAGDDHVVAMFAPEDIAGADDTYDGADVFILGFPGLVGEEYQQRALMRSGVIAWTDSSGPTDHEFVVDFRPYFPAIRGARVGFAAGITRDASITAGKPTKLLGLVSKTVNAKPELALGMHLPDNALVIGAASVGIIEPAHELLELMAQAPDGAYRMGK